MINYDELEKELNSNLKSLYLLYGDEKYLIDMALKKIKKKFDELVKGINYVVIDETNITELLPSIEMPAFGYDRKLIVVKNSELFKKDGRKKTETPMQEAISNYINENNKLLDESIVIVFIEDDANKTSVYEAIDKYGTICNISKLKAYQLTNKIKKVCDLYGVKISGDTLNYFIETCGTSLQVLINEIRKLIEYKGKDGTITKEDIDKLSIKELESVIFDLTDNLGLKRINLALETLDNLLYQNEPLQMIFVILYNHFKRLYLTSQAMILKKDIVQTLGLKANQTFLVDKYKMQAKLFNISDLRKLLNDFNELDYKYKNGNIDLDVGLRSLLCELCI